jgi:DNA-binding NarL/FixJ family response regulator
VDKRPTIQAAAVYVIMRSDQETAIHQIRVIIADDHPVVREGLTAILKSQQDIAVVAEAADGAEACELYDRLVPDVLILDLHMPKNGLQVLTELSSRVPAPRIIVMTVSENDEDVRDAASAGAKGYLVKGASPRQIREAVRTVASGESLFPAGVVPKSLESTMTDPELSERELQILHFMADGRSDLEIGRALSISESMVRNHVRSIITN